MKFKTEEVILYLAVLTCLYSLVDFTMFVEHGKYLMHPWISFMLFVGSFFICLTIFIKAISKNV